jgi:AhpD family alkylhydroperoxidase
MTRLPIHDLESAPEHSKPALEKALAKFGAIGNLQAGLANSPAAIQSYMAMKGALTEYAILEPSTQEAIALAVGAVNACNNCQSAHTWAGIRAGLTEEQTVALRGGVVDWDPKLAAIVELVREAAEHVGDVADETWQAGVDAGWTDAELAEAGAHVAANLFTNYFNHYAKTQLGKMKPAPGIEVDA